MVVRVGACGERILVFESASGLMMMGKWRRWLDALMGPAPLDNFVDYDQYWEMRKERGEIVAFLPRHKIVANSIPDGSTVLDVGCGDGAFLKYLRSVKPSCRGVGADISQTAVDAVRSEGIEAYKIQPSGLLDEQIPERFDYVTMMEVVEHVHDAESLVLGASRLMRKRMFVTAPNVGFLICRLRLGLFGRFPITAVLCHMKEHIRFWTVKDFREWCEHLGLAVLNVRAQVGDSEPRLIRLLANSFPGIFAKQLVFEIGKGEGIAGKAKS